MSQFQFDEWLDYLKHTQEAQSSYEGYDPEFSDEDLEALEFLNRIGWQIPLTIQIMESSIFREGRLRGRKISGKYRLYHIENTHEFLIALVTILNDLENIKNQKQRVAQKFDDLISNYDELSKIVFEYKGVRPEKVKAIRHDLEVMKDRTLNKLSPNSNLTPDIVPSLINLFKKYISTAPNQTIASRISDLLSLVGFDVKPETIRKKLQLQFPTD